MFKLAAKWFLRWVGAWFFGGPLMWFAGGPLAGLVVIPVCAFLLVGGIVQLLVRRRRRDQRRRSGAGEDVPGAAGPHHRRGLFGYLEQAQRATIRRMDTRWRDRVRNGDRTVDIGQVVAGLDRRWTRHLHNGERVATWRQPDWRAGARGVRDTPRRARRAAADNVREARERRSARRRAESRVEVPPDLVFISVAAVGARGVHASVLGAEQSTVCGRGVNDRAEAVGAVNCPDCKRFVGGASRVGAGVSG